MIIIMYEERSGQHTGNGNTVHSEHKAVYSKQKPEDIMIGEISKEVSQEKRSDWMRKGMEGADN